MKVALIAHDKKKPMMLELVSKYKNVLELHELYATGNDWGHLLRKQQGLNVHCKKEKWSPWGDQEIGSMIANDGLDLVIFLRDPLSAQPHEPDVSALLRLCDVTSTPISN